MTDQNIRNLTSTALMTAVLCVLGPLSLPIGPVPVSLTNLALYFMLYIVGTRTTSIAYLLYMLIGLVGMPVFSGYAGGPSKLFGPTGGYLIGFLPMILLMGYFIERNWKNRVSCILVMEASTWIPYLLGTLWLSFSTGISFGKALGVGVLPFVVVDLCKMCAAAAVGPVLHARLSRAGVMA